MVKLAEKYKRDIVSSLNLKPNQTFFVNKYKTQAQCFTEKEIRGILDDMITLDTNYKLRFNRCKYRCRNYFM